MGLSFDQQSLRSHLSFRRHRLPFPVLMGFAALISAAAFRSLSKSRGGFLSGCLWVPFMIDRLEHRFKTRENLGQISATNDSPAKATHYGIHQTGNLYFSAELEDFVAAGHGPGRRESDRHGHRHAPRRSGGFAPVTCKNEKI
jgi:hypothetical protein